MQFSVVTWRPPLDEEVVGAEGLGDDHGASLKWVVVRHVTLKSNFTF